MKNKRQDIITYVVRKENSLDPASEANIYISFVFGFQIF